MALRIQLPEHPPKIWPRFTSPLRSTALTARVGRLLGICFGICFVTGLLSHYQYQPWTWLPEPAAPKWGYRITQGVHVATGTAAIPLLFVKLWSVYPNLFRWPPLSSGKNALERFSVALLVSSSLVELSTGFFNALNWYPWSWDFVPVHRFLGYVVIGSILLHIGIKLPDIKYGLQTKLKQGDVLTEKAWWQNPHAYSNNDNTHQPPPETPAISRRGVLVAAGTGVGIVVVTSIGQTVTPLEPVGLLAIRQPSKGPQRVPVNRTADQAAVRDLAVSPSWRLQVKGPHPFVISLDELNKEVAAGNLAAESFPISCVEGWSVGAFWQGLRLLSLVRRAGGDAGSKVRLTSLEPKGSYNFSFVSGPQLETALLATHLNHERLDVEHGYPLRLIAPDRAGVLQTKWLDGMEVL